MIRPWLLPQPCPTLLLVLLAVTAVAPRAVSQEATTQERLDRMERDLSMLQRQVYRGGVSSGADAAGASGNLAADTQIRMDRLEQQMRDLTGRVEDETNQVQQLRQRLEQIDSDLEVRLGQGSGQAVAPRPPSRASRQAEILSPPAIAGGMGPGYRDRPPPPFAANDGSPASEPPLPADPEWGPGTLTPPGVAAEPPRLAPPPPHLADEAHPPSRKRLPSASVSAQYNSAFGLLRQADYAAAEDALRNFIQQHPDSPLAGNAQYWLGESYYARGKYAEAAITFAAGYKRYPKGAKAADDLLKLAMALDRADQKQNACVALAQLDHAFPHSGNALRQRAATEKKRLGC